jgi:hypothetical protein
MLPEVEVELARLVPNGRILAKPIRPTRRSTQKDGPMTNTATETLSVVIERSAMLEEGVTLSAGKDLARSRNHS